MAYTVKVPRPAPVLGPYKVVIERRLAANAPRPRQQRYTAHKIFEVLPAQDYAGREPSVGGDVARCRKEGRRCTVDLPLAFDPGTDAQVEWGAGIAIIADEQIAGQLFGMRLCCARRTVVMVFPAPRQEAFFEGHPRAFCHCQGVPQRITYDNLKTAVQRVLAGHTRQAQQACIVFRSRDLFENHFCTPGEGREKGGRAQCGRQAAQLHGPQPPGLFLRGAQCPFAGAASRRRPTARAGPSHHDWRGVATRTVLLATGAGTRV
jgi:hypothetical protein